MTITITTTNTNMHTTTTTNITTKIQRTRCSTPFLTLPFPFSKHTPRPLTTPPYPTSTTTPSIPQNLNYTPHLHFSSSSSSPCSSHLATAGALPFPIKHLRIPAAQRQCTNQHADIAMWSDDRAEIGG